MSQATSTSSLRSLAAAAATLASAAALALLGCGGSSKPAAAPAASPSPSAASDDGSNVISNETMDEIQRALDRKRNVMSRCLTAAIDAGELPKNARGRITLSFVISPVGKAEDRKIVKASLDSAKLNDCVLERVSEIEFPTVPNQLPWSYTYGFEAM
jgi:hypothetical protein